MSNIREHLCPDCNGAGENTVIACPGGRLMTLKCQFCEATGFITAERHSWRAAGQEHRRERLARDENMHECSKRIGVLASEVSRFERGLIDPQKWRPTPEDADK